ncbi:MAG: TonB-dependent receptor [Holophagaceae bacterium]|nr:TonB-dependent receptor [Holophagaceae bacterium]
MKATRILFILALGANLSAETVEPADRPKPKADAAATVTVTAEAAPVDLAKTPNPVKVLDGDAIRRSGAQTLGDLLAQFFPGQIQAYGGPGTVASLYLGGTRARDVVVLLNGIRITDASGLSADFGTIGLEGIERVEILSGPASTRYGSDTHGGVVALYSAGPSTQGLSGEALLGLGTRGVKQGRLSPAFGWGNGWVRLDLRTAGEEQSTETTSPFRSSGAALNFGQQVGSEGLATLTYRNHSQGTPLPYDADYPLPNYEFTKVYSPDRESTLRNEQLIGSYRQNVGDALLAEFSVGQSLQDRVEPGYGAYPDRYHSQRNQGVAMLSWTPSAGLRLSGMLDANDEVSTKPNGDRAEGRHFALGLESAFDLTHSIRIVASLRNQKDRIAYRFDDGSTVPERSSSATVGKLGINWSVAPDARVFASFGTSYNTPDLYPLTFNLSKGFGDLQNEKSRTLQVGAAVEHGPWSARLEASRTAYDTVVYYVPLPWPNSHYENGTNLRVQGIEGSASFRSVGWMIQAFARSQEARNVSQPEEKQLTTGGAIGRPFFTGGLRGSAAFGDWDLFARWSWVGSSYQYFDDLGGVSGARTHFNDLGLGATRKLAQRLSLEARAEHLLQPRWTREDWLEGRRFRENDAYLVPTFPAPGPTLTVALRYRY